MTEIFPHSDASVTLLPDIHFPPPDTPPDYPAPSRIDGNPSHDYIVEVAKSLTATREMRRDFDLALKKSQLFQRHQRDFLETAAKAYPLYLHLLADQEGAQTIALELKLVEKRHRKPKKGTEATIAFSMAASSAKEHRNKCSQEGTRLIYAAAQDIPPEKFQELMGTVSLKECREFAAKYRKTLRKHNDRSEQQTFSANVKLGDVEFRCTITNAQLKSARRGKRPRVELKPVNTATASVSSPE